MNIQTIRGRIREDNYLTKPHTVQHALKEGFRREHIVEAILGGDIIEEYLNVQRVLICGHTRLGDITTYLHVCMWFVNMLIRSILNLWLLIFLMRFNGNLQPSSAGDAKGDNLWDPNRLQFAPNTTQKKSGSRPCLNIARMVYLSKYKMSSSRSMLSLRV